MPAFGLLLNNKLVDKLIARNLEMSDISIFGECSLILHFFPKLPGSDLKTIIFEEYSDKQLADGKKPNFFVANMDFLNNLRDQRAGEMLKNSNFVWEECINVLMSSGKP